MKNLVTIFLISMFALNANFAWSDVKNSTQEYNIADSHDAHKDHERIRNEFKYKQKEDKKEFRESRDVCFKKCRINVEKINDCKLRATTASEKAACLSNTQKECLMECKSVQLETMGFKPSPERHLSCFQTCNVNKDALKQCRKKYQDRGMSLKGKCLQSSERSCLQSCMK
ncbi:MAG TPA: hypothetical protein DCL21_01945 [Alphaproteobacteria bacterium]|nr:hypothetical protein [Alphaproteobacteria bacterium]